ncbi:MAG TPA: hypothetical protein VNN22_16105 [Verrucomicrobiae bacterium]|nr:hypothetical protein [Verrucomicrobiae bacterium]
MARFILSAAAESGNSTPGNDAPAGLVVTVTDTAGKPVTKLKQANFQVQAFLSGTQAVLVSFFEESPSDGNGLKLPGVYHLGPALQGQAWKKDIYALAIVVKRGSDLGSTAASLDLH